MYRIGNGYDVHRLVEGRELILGGVTIPHSLGLLGHSDADALMHAVCDALLGAAGAGDIGTHFPSTDPQWKDVASRVFLEESGRICGDRGYEIANVDATIVAQKPKIAPFIAAMQQNIAESLKLDPDRINIKATTTEKLGYVGREEGIACYAVALLMKTPPDDPS